MVQSSRPFFVANRTGIYPGPGRTANKTEDHAVSSLEATWQPRSLLQQQGLRQIALHPFCPSMCSLVVLPSLLCNCCCSALLVVHGVGTHCALVVLQVLLVGFDNDDEYWIAKNSWGTGFADKGFFRIAFGVSGVGSFGDTYGLAWEPVMPPAQQAELTPVPGRPACFWYTGRPWDFVSRVVNRFRLQIGQVLLDNRDVITDPRQSLGGVKLVLCDIEPGLVPPATEVQALLQFKQQADPDNTLDDWQPTNATANASLEHCRWAGVSWCFQGGAWAVRDSVLPSTGGCSRYVHAHGSVLSLLAGSHCECRARACMHATQCSFCTQHCICSASCRETKGKPIVLCLLLRRWTGVRCINGTVHNIILQGPLSGVLPSAVTLAGLPALRRLHLSAAELSGTLPAGYAALEQLQELRLSGCTFSGGIPDGWGTGLPRLLTLVMADCKLSGSLPVSLSKLPSLATLNLTGNSLRGPLPGAWSQWGARISLVDLSSNRLNSTLPAAWSAWTGLKTLSLAGNRLTGTLPGSWARMMALQSLNLAANLINGTLPTGWGDGMTSVSRMRLNHNRFTGTLPASWASYSELFIIQVNNNLLSGGLSKLPASTCTQIGQAATLLPLLRCRRW
jgi:hypothetical protein